MSRINRLQLIAILLLLPAAAFAQSASRAYMEAVYQESITGDLPAAIMLYAQAAGASEDPELVARATLRMGNCYKKLGQARKARAAYRKVVDEFPSQKSPVRLAKLALLGLGPGEEELKKWPDRLGAEVAQLRAALESVRAGIAGIKADLSTRDSGDRDGEEALRAFEEMVLREETRRMLKRYLSSHYFRTALARYGALDYEGALEDFLTASRLRPDDALVRGYLEKTEFILGRRPKLTPAAAGSAPDNPSTQLLKELEAAFALATQAGKEGSHRMALAAVEEILERVRWTDDALISDRIRKLLEKADALAQECLIRLYPSESRHIKMLSEERTRLADALKRKLDEVIASRRRPQESTDAVIEKARGLVGEGCLPEAKELIEHHLAGEVRDARARALLEEIDSSIRRDREEEENVKFSVLAAAVALPSNELNMLKIPFASLKPSEGEGVPFAWATLSQEKGKELLSVAALAGREALGKFPDMNVVSGQKGSGFLGSSMTYISGYRKRPDAPEAGEYEPINDIIFQGIRLSASPSLKGKKVSLTVEATVSVVAGEPRLVQTEGGQIEIPRLYQVALRHAFELNAGEYIIVGTFPSTLVPGSVKEKDDMYLLLSPRRVNAPSGEGKPGKAGK